MQSLQEQLLSKKKETYQKLKNRFFRNLSSRKIEAKTNRDKHYMVTKLQHIESQLGIRSSSKLKHWALALALGVVTIASQAQTVPFRPEQIPSEPILSSDMTLADFDGDGDVDIVNVAFYGYHSIMLGDGNGAFSRPVTIGSQTSESEVFTHGDFDGDGDEDLLIVEGYTEGVRANLWSNDGTGAFTESEAFTLSNYEIPENNLQVGDLDDDGDLDLLVRLSLITDGSTQGEQNWGALLNDGTGSFSYFSLKESLTSLASAAMVHAGDFDNDGDADILLLNSTANLYFYQNDGDLTNMTQTSTSISVSAPNNLHSKLADMDGDGNLDVVISYDYNSDYVKIFSGDGAGAFSETFSFGLDGQGEFSVIDADGDTQLDLLMLTEPVESASEWKVFRVTTDPMELIDLNQTFNSRYKELKGFYPGDFDNDGDDDILAGSYYEVVSFNNDGAGNFTTGNEGLIDPIFAIHTEVADLNGDGALDMIGNRLGQVFINDGTGNFTVTQNLARETGYINDFQVLGDLDGDGDLDVVLAGRDLNAVSYGHGLLVQVALNDGDGGFVPMDAYEFSNGQEVFALTMIDYDSDEILEVVLATDVMEGSSLSILENDGTGVLSNSDNPPISGAVDAFSLKNVGDIDGDGDEDLVMLTSKGAIRLNYSAQGWASYSGLVFDEVNQELTNGDLADFDEDGDLDLIFSNGIDSGTEIGKNLLIPNDSTVDSYFSNSTSYDIQRTTGSQDAQAADFDNDGDQDVLLADYTYGNTLFLNDGTTGFVFSEDAGGPVIKSYNVSAGDFDGDGDTDLFAVAFNRKLYVVFNDLIAAPVLEDQSFVIAENPLNGSIVGSLVATDVNMDELSYTIIGGNDAGAFSISGGDLTVNDSTLLDFETNASFSLEVEVFDGALQDVAVVDVEISDVDEIPVVEVQTFQVDENLTNGTVIGTIVASDPEGAALTFSISSGNDLGTFALESTSGELSVLDSTRLDFELIQEIKLVVEVSDGTLTSGVDVVIEISDVFDSTVPIFPSQTFSIAENPLNGQVVGSLEVSDPNNESITLSILSGDPDSAFILSASNELIVNDSTLFDFESHNQYVLEMQADNDVEITLATITVDLTNVNEVPKVAEALFRSDQNRSNGAVVGTILAEDPEGDVLTYSFTSGNESDAFAINAGTGQITVNNSESIDYDVTPDYTLTVNVTDGALIGEATATIKITTLERDKSALLELYANVSGESWATSTNWNDANSLTNDWFGITIEEGRVTSLALPDNGLDGAVPESFGDLTGLQSIDLSGNSLTSIPDLTPLPNLTSLDVSDNHLTTRELLPNVSVTSYTYAPQKEFGELLVDTAYAGTDFSLVYPGLESSEGDVYQWYLDEELVSGATEKDFEISDLNFDKMGAYHLKVENAQLPLLSLTTAQYVIWAATDVSGTVFSGIEDNVLSSGQVDIYRIFNGPFALTDSAEISTDGTYFIEKVVLGEFILLVKNDPIIYPDIIQTYYESTGFWQEADTLRLLEAAEAIDIEMISKPEYVSIENGADIEGTVETDFVDDVTDGRVAARRKVKRAGCSMRRFVSRGRVYQEGIFVDYAYIESDDEGRFNFEGVEPGTYRLNIEYPGIPMDPNSEIEFVISENEENILYRIEAVVSEEGISVSSNRVLSSEKPHLKAINLYPNPTDGPMQVDFLVYRNLNDLKVEVINIEGRKLFEQELDATLGLQSAIIDLTPYQSGIYVLVFKDAAGSFNYLVKVSKK